VTQADKNTSAFKLGLRQLTENTASSTELITVDPGIVQSKTVTPSTRDAQISALTSPGQLNLLRW
jgi:hypothetical protein